MAFEQAGFNDLQAWTDRGLDSCQSNLGLPPENGLVSVRGGRPVVLLARWGNLFLPISIRVAAISSKYETILPWGRFFASPTGILRERIKKCLLIDDIPV